MKRLGDTVFEYIEWCSIAYAITVTGLPTLSMLAGFTASGLPVGLQVVGSLRGEASLLAGAHKLERHRPRRRGANRSARRRRPDADQTMAETARWRCWRRRFGRRSPYSVSYLAARRRRHLDRHHLPVAVDEIGGLRIVNWAVALYELGTITAGAVTGLLVARISGVQILGPSPMPPAAPQAPWRRRWRFWWSAACSRGSVAAA